eukprot:gene25474-31116_t
MKYLQDPVRRTFAGMVGTLDESVGEIIAALQDKGVYDNTIVVFMSDNGGKTKSILYPEMYIGSNNSPLRGEKGSLYEGATRVVGL